MPLNWYPIIVETTNGPERASWLYRNMMNTDENPRWVLPSWGLEYDTYYFKHERDAILFKLRFGAYND